MMMTILTQSTYKTESKKKHSLEKWILNGCISSTYESVTYVFLLINDDFFPSFFFYSFLFGASSVEALVLNVDSFHQHKQKEVKKIAHYVLCVTTTWNKYNFFFFSFSFFFSLCSFALLLFYFLAFCVCLCCRCAFKSIELSAMMWLNSYRWRLVTCN